MEQLRPNTQRAKNAILLIWIMLMLDVVLLLSNLMQYHLLDTAANGGEISTAEAEANNIRQQVLTVVHLVTFIISIVTFLQWFRRAHFNLSTQVPLYKTYTNLYICCLFPASLCCYQDDSPRS